MSTFFPPSIGLVETGIHTMLQFDISIIFLYEYYLFKILTTLFEKLFQRNMAVITV